MYTFGVSLLSVELSVQAPMHAKLEEDIITSTNDTVETEVLTAECAVRAGKRISVLCIVAV